MPEAPRNNTPADAGEADRDRPRLLIAATQYPPFPFGVSELARQQAMALTPEFRVRVLAPWPTREELANGSDDTAESRRAAERRDADDGLEVHRFNTIRLPVVRLLPFFVRVAWEFLRFRPAAVFVPDYRAMGLVVWLLTRVWRVPYVGYFHGTELRTEVGKWPREALARRYLESAAARLTNSRHTAGTVAQLAPSAPAATVVAPGSLVGWFGEERDDGRATMRERIGCTDNRRLIVTVARLDHRKAVDLVIESLAIVNERDAGLGATIDYLVVGDGRDRAMLETMARDRGFRVESLDGASSGNDGSAGPRVIFAGLQPRDAVRDALHAADLFVLTSRDLERNVESFGMVYIEANAAGCAVIGSDVGGVSDAIADGESGLLVPPENPAATAEAIEKLLRDDELRARLAEQGRERAAREFDWSVIGARLRDAVRAATRR